MSLFDELQKAISCEDRDEINRIQRMILLAGRDETLDENLIESLKGKTIHKNLCRIVSNEKELSCTSYAKIISSLITHNIIESEKTGKPLQDYPINELYILLGNFINGEGDAINECKRFIHERYSKFL